MAGEITGTLSLNVRKSDSATPPNVLIDERLTARISNDMTGSKGPSPGSIQALTIGTQVNFSALTQPTWCWIQNQGPSDGSVATAAEYTQYGIYDPASHKFYPLGELGVGEAVAIKLSRNLQEIYLGPGTGTAAGGETARMMLLANSKAQNILVSAFEK